MLRLNFRKVVPWGRLEAGGKEAPVQFKPDEIRI